MGEYGGQIDRITEMIHGCTVLSDGCGLQRNVAAAIVVDDDKMLVLYGIHDGAHKGGRKFLFLRRGEQSCQGLRDDHAVQSRITVGLGV